MAHTVWTDTEQFAVCLAYCIMQQADARGERVNKSALRRQLIGTDEQPGPLHARSNGSIEAKLMNVSAVAMTLGHVTVRGYKPAPHYQKSLRVWYVTASSIVRQDSDAGHKTDVATALQVTV
jgi:hypothetical protein